MINYWKNRNKILTQIRIDRENSKKKQGKKLYRCKSCNKLSSHSEVINNNYICKYCLNYFSMPAMERLNTLLDEFKIINIPVEFNNPTDFKNYEKNFRKEEMRTNLQEAVVVADGYLNKHRVVMFVMDTDFFMATMGYNTGKIIIGAIEYAKENNLPLIGICAGGGARMQEGVFSLIQMANTLMHLKNFLKKNLYISVLTDPTMGGISASFASVADIVIAEKGARIGFSGKRVIEQPINQNLDDYYQSAEFVYEHGFLDEVVQRENLKDYLDLLLEYHNV